MENMLCLEKIASVLSNCFIKEKYFWKIVCFSCTVFLVFQLILDYFYTMPTGSTFEKIELSPNVTPDILICRSEGFFIKNLEKHGYKSHLYQYMNGLGQHGKFIGWNGINDTDPLRKPFKHFIKNYVV